MTTLGDLAVPGSIKRWRETEGAAKVVRDRERMNIRQSSKAQVNQAREPSTPARGKLQQISFVDDCNPGSFANRATRSSGNQQSKDERVSFICNKTAHRVNSTKILTATHTPAHPQKKTIIAQNHAPFQHKLRVVE